MTPRSSCPLHPHAVSNAFGAPLSRLDCTSCRDEGWHRRANSLKRSRLLGRGCALDEVSEAFQVGRDEAAKLFLDRPFGKSKEPAWPRADGLLQERRGFVSRQPVFLFKAHRPGNTSPTKTTRRLERQNLIWRADPEDPGLRRHLKSRSDICVSRTCLPGRNRALGPLRQILIEVSQYGEDLGLRAPDRNSRCEGDHSAGACHNAGTRGAYPQGRAHTAPSPASSRSSLGTESVFRSQDQSPLKDLDDDDERFRASTRIAQCDPACERTTSSA
jgi:hypothetical protein